MDQWQSSYKRGAWVWIDAAAACTMMFTSMHVLSVGLATYSVSRAECTSEGDPGRLPFLLLCSAILALLHVCVRELERVRRREEGELLKAAVWLLAVALSFVFCRRATLFVGELAAVFAWYMFALSALLGFCLLFLLGLDDGAGDHRAPI